MLSFTTFLTGLAREYNSLLLFQGAQGLFEGFFLISAYVLLTSSFRLQETGRALGIMEVGVGIGAFTILSAASWVAILLGWRSVFLVASLPGIAIILLMLKYTRASWRPIGISARIKYKEAISHPYIPIIAFPIAVMNMNWFAVWMLSPTFLVDVKNLDLAYAGFIGGVSIALGIPATPIGGWAADKLGPKPVSVGLFLAYTVSLVLFVLMPTTWIMLIFYFLLGASLAAVFVTVLAILPRKLPSTIIGSALGLMITLAYVAGSLNLLLMGYIADLYSFQTAFLALAAITLIGILPFALKG